MSAAPTTHTQTSGSDGWRGGSAASVSEILDKGISEGVVDGALIAAAQHGRFTIQICRGNKVALEGTTESAPLEFTTVFDLGTLTEVVCTATLMMRLISGGKVNLLDRASRFVQSLAVGQRSQITLAHLLAHAAGYGTTTGVADEIVRAHTGPRPGLLSSSGARQYAYNFLHKLPPRYEPGTRQLRSDADYIVLGEICEAITGMSLEKAFSRFVAAPLGLRSLNFIELSSVRSKNVRPMTEVFAPMGKCSRRGRVVCGEVWDEHTWAMGGVSGHNGLFGTADDLIAWAAEILSALKGRSDIISAEVARAFLAPNIAGLDPDWRLGFDGVVSPEGAAEAGVAPEAVTVSSATGCSVVIEPKRDLIAIVLTSGGVANGMTKRFAAMRSDIHAALLETE
jgi:CubicO group peptidase (beta-lactamase class C family)